MNPGGDFGKRELSPALRNRFTEIWVDPITAPYNLVIYYIELIFFVQDREFEGVDSFENEKIKGNDIVVMVKEMMMFKLGSKLE